MKPLKPLVYEVYAKLISQQLVHYQIEEVKDFYHNTFLPSLDDTHNFSLEELRNSLNINNSKIEILVYELEKTIFEDKKLRRDLSNQLNFFN